MKISLVRRLTRSLLFASSVALTVCRLCAADLNLFGTNVPPVDFHGFVTQGFIETTKYNYLGTDTKEGSFKFTEAGFNVAMNPLPRTRIAAQAFTYDIGDVGNYDVVLDYASIEYTFNDYFGLRGGRVRRSQGIYNSVEDLDMTYTFALLPQGVYDLRWRDFLMSVDGIDYFGDIPLGKAGDLSYEGYTGMINPSMNGGLATYFSATLPPDIKLVSMFANLESGMQLWWNTPVNGLRVGGFYSYDYKAGYGTRQAGVTTDNYYNVHNMQASLEYRWKSWTFQSEYYSYIIMPQGGNSYRADDWYGSAAYRFNKWFEAGAYYNAYYANTTQRDNPLAYQKDAALALRFDPTSWWVFKVEGHLIHGTGLLEDNTSNPIAQQNGQPWFMLVVKTTFSF